MYEFKKIAKVRFYNCEGEQYDYRKVLVNVKYKQNRIVKDFELKQYMDVKNIVIVSCTVKIGSYNEKLNMFFSDTIKIGDSLFIEVKNCEFYFRCSNCIHYTVVDDVSSNIPPHKRNTYIIEFYYKVKDCILLPNIEKSREWII